MTFSTSFADGACRCVNIDYTGLIVVDPGVKINEIRYCSFLLQQQLLAVVRQVSGEFRNSVPVNRWREFSDININISPGSVVTRLRCCKIVNGSFIANLL